MGFCGSATVHNHRQHRPQNTRSNNSDATDDEDNRKRALFRLQQQRYRIATDGTNHQHPHRAGCAAIEQKNAADAAAALNNGLHSAAATLDSGSTAMPHNGAVAADLDNRVATVPPYNVRLVADLRQLLTLRQHYYPEGGWGWLLVGICFIVQTVTHGLHLAGGLFVVQLQREFGGLEFVPAVSLVAVSFATGLVVSPVTIALCKRKSTRLVAVIGGLVAALGCLFTSFALQLPQVAFSYALLLGLGVNVTRDCSTVMVAQYFKKRRELVEVFVVAGSGAGAAVMAWFYSRVIGAYGWR